MAPSSPPSTCLGPVGGNGIPSSNCLLYFMTRLRMSKGDCGTSHTFIPGPFEHFHMTKVEGNFDKGFLGGDEFRKLMTRVVVSESALSYDTPLPLCHMT